MVRLVKCDKCGAISEGDIEYYSLNRYGEDVNEEAELCPECLPDEMSGVLRSVEY